MLRVEAAGGGHYFVKASKVTVEVARQAKRKVSGRIYARGEVYGWEARQSFQRRQARMTTNPAGWRFVLGGRILPRG